MRQMSTYIIDLSLGVGLGIISFFILPAVQTDIFIVRYYFVGLLIFIAYSMLPWRKKQVQNMQNKYSFLFFSFLCFIFGFTLPAAAWAFMVIRAFENSILF